MIIQPSRHPRTGADFDEIRDYERGYHEGHGVGFNDAKWRRRSGLYAAGRDERPNWYAQGYNNGYVAGHEAARYDRDLTTD